MPTTDSPRRRVLVVTSLFPSNVDPGHAPFNRRQFAALRATVDVEIVGVVPRRLGDARVRGLVAEETIDSLPVVHKRYLSLPGLPSLNAGLMVAGLIRYLARRARAQRYDVLLSSYAYPDGCAGVVLGRLLGLPVVVKCHGSDLNRVTKHHLVKTQLKHWLPRAHAVVAVSHHLARRACELGVPEDRVHVVYNGIDRRLFRPMKRCDARRRLSLPLEREIVLYVGHLEEHKGVGDLLHSAGTLRKLRPRAMIVFVGGGPFSQPIRAAATAHQPTVLAPGLLPQDAVPLWMAAADVVCLPSWNEGMPNVIREAHACGRPVVATDVGGIPEAVSTGALGILVPPRQPEVLAEALAQQLGRPTDPDTITRLAQVPTWEESAEHLSRVVECAIRRS